MATPEYRQKIQDLVNELMLFAPEDWVSLRVRATFESRVTTDFEVLSRDQVGGKEVDVDVPSDNFMTLVGALRSLRAELVRAGNPECRTLWFSLDRAGKSSVDVEY